MTKAGCDTPKNCFFCPMIEIDFEAWFPKLRFKRAEGRTWVFDPVRRKFVVAEKEELLRQVLILYFIEGKKYPKAKMAVEKMVVVNDLRRRFDLLVYGPDMEPFLLVECKNPRVPIDEAVFRQIAMYNLPLRVPYLLVTNGIQTWCCRIDFEAESWSFLPELPHYPAENSDS